MSAGRETKIEPRDVKIHGVASKVAAFLVPVSELVEIAGKIDVGAHPSGLVIGLDVEAATADGDRQFGIVLGPYVDPTELAGELEALASAIVERAAIDLGLDTIEARRQARAIAREHRIAARREVAETIPHNVTCDECGRSVYLIEDGRRLCKRHAEAAGLRPKGKIT